MTSAYPDLSDFSMLDIFRMEAATQVAVMNDNLLALEAQAATGAEMGSKPNDASSKQLEALMRSAHSIKGAAHIVGLDLVVGVAHVMEDCFVAVQNGQIQLQSRQIDILLDAVDWFTQLSQCLANELPAWLEQQVDTTHGLVSAIAALSNSPASPSAPTPAPAPAPVPAPGTPTVGPVIGSIPPASTQPSPVNLEQATEPLSHNISYPSSSRSEPGLAEAQERVVRISAEQLTQIMA